MESPHVNVWNLAGSSFREERRKDYANDSDESIAHTYMDYFDCNEEDLPGYRWNDYRYRDEWEPEYDFDRDEVIDEIVEADALAIDDYEKQRINGHVIVYDFANPSDFKVLNNPSMYELTVVMMDDNDKDSGAEFYREGNDFGVFTVNFGKAKDCLVRYLSEDAWDTYSRTGVLPDGDIEGFTKSIGKEDFGYLV